MEDSFNLKNAADLNSYFKSYRKEKVMDETKEQGKGKIDQRIKKELHSLHGVKEDLEELPDQLVLGIKDDIKKLVAEKEEKIENLLEKKKEKIEEVKSEIATEQKEIQKVKQETRKTVKKIETNI
jgi:chromosome segregation ATPase